MARSSLTALQLAEAALTIMEIAGSTLVRAMGIDTRERCNMSDYPSFAGLDMERVFITDVCLRDGLQMESAFVPTETKIGLSDALSHSGVAKIELTSFTSAKAIPALADAEEVALGITRNPDVAYIGLVPNLRGF